MEPESTHSYRNCYAFPNMGNGVDLGLFRLGGRGLANFLFAWARCLVQARRYGLKRISPTWPQLMPGPWLRNDPDKRTYHNLFDPAPDEVSGFRRLRLLATSHSVAETQLGSPIPEGSIVVFRGRLDYLVPAVPYPELVRAELLQIVRPEHKTAIEAGFSPAIALHVRLGDFSGSDPSRGNSRIDIDWYIAILTSLRAKLGPLSASLFSDGTDEELAPLLEIDGVTRVTFGSSIADIIALSQARILVTSGSTFSMWASFLGQMPTVWYPQRIYHPVLKNPRRELETFQELPAEFTAECVSSLDETVTGASNVRG